MQRFREIVPLNTDQNETTFTVSVRVMFFKISFYCTLVVNHDSCVGTLNNGGV